MMRRQFDDPDQAVSFVAVLFFVGAAFLFIQLLISIGALFSPVGLLLLALCAGQVASAAGLLKTRRWAWPLAVGAASLEGAFALWQFSFAPLSGLLGLLFAGIALYLLFRPAVRERFGLSR